MSRIYIQKGLEIDFSFLFLAMLTSTNYFLHLFLFLHPNSEDKVVNSTVFTFHVYKFSYLLKFIDNLQMYALKILWSLVVIFGARKDVSCPMCTFSADVVIGNTLPS